MLILSYAECAGAVTQFKCINQPERYGRGTNCHFTQSKITNPKNSRIRCTCFRDSSCSLATSIVFLDRSMIWLRHVPPFL